MHIHSNTTQRVQEAPGARRGLASNRWSNSRPCVLPDLLRHASMNDLLAYETLDKYPPRRRLSRSPLVSPTYASMNDLHAYDTPPPFTLTSCLPDWQITTTNVGAAGAHETMLLVRIEARTRDYRGDGCSVARHGTRHHVCLRRDASMDRRCTPLAPIYPLTLRAWHRGDALGCAGDKSPPRPRAGRGGDGRTGDL